MARDHNVIRAMQYFEYLVYFYFSYGSEYLFHHRIITFEFVVYIFPHFALFFIANHMSLN